MRRLLALSLAVSVCMNVILFVSLLRPTSGPQKSPANDITCEKSPQTSLPKFVGHPLSQDDCSQLRAQLAEAQTRLTSKAPLSERFTLSTDRRSPDANTVRFLDRLFGVGSNVAYTIECHGAVCRLDIVTPEPPANWVEELQQHGFFKRVAFTTDGVYFEELEPGRGPANQIIIDLASAFMSKDKEVAQCKENSKSGTLVLTTSLDPSARRILISQSGTLANTPMGDCVMRILVELARPILVPADVTDLPPWPLPPIVVD